jgi:hypothetical protein
MADDETPRNADFVGRVVSDPKNPPEARMLTGWFGDAAEEGYRRLYTDAELSCYIDIPTDSILHTEPVRDMQPAGGVFVWIKRDAALKPGGSAASRAARFLQGQVQQDFASGGGGLDLSSPEKAGYRCVTQVPCGEPTGITGECTKQPEVGGAWSCITAVPHCFEPTGFTGQCTHQPWPNPTRYLGCTFIHCPTQDLTHIPHICNLVATGMPGCAVVDPGAGGGDPAMKSAGGGGGGEGAGGSAERAAVPATSIPGCGYTRTWGLCATLPPKCNVSVDIPCITHDNACGVTRNPACLANANAAGGGFGFRAAAPGPIIPINTQLPSCNVSLPDACPSLKECITQQPTAIPPCTHAGPHCPQHTPATTCTQIGLHCPTSCGPDCQSQQVNCTQMGEICLTHPVECTQSGPKCPSVGAPCPTPECTIPPGCPNTQVGPACPTPTPPVCWQPAQAFRAVGPIGPSAFLGCTQGGAQCPTVPSGDCTFFGGCTQLAPCPTHHGHHCPTPQFECTMFCTHGGPGCPPLTQTIQCGGNPSAVDACPTRLCGGGQQFFGAAARGAAGGPIGPTGFHGCTQFQTQCPTIACRENTYYPCTHYHCYQPINTSYMCWNMG